MTRLLLTLDHLQHGGALDLGDWVGLFLLAGLMVLALDIAVRP